MSRTHTVDIDLEAQTSPENKAIWKHLSSKNDDSTTQKSTKFEYLIPYFICNVSLMLYNKAVLGKFDYPWLLTTLHAASASLGCSMLYLRGRIQLTKLPARAHLTLIMFSFLFTINIAISNVSLSMVSMPFHQVLRSTCPIFTILICRLCYHHVYSTKTYLSLIPVIFGVALATYGDYYFTAYGFILTILGVVLASIKTVATNRIMTGPLALSPMETLLRLSPLAFLQSLLVSAFNGELSAFAATCDASNAPFLAIPLPSRNTTLILGFNGALAFLLNVASFLANKNTGALTMTVCGNVKQCLTILLGIILFGVKVGILNGTGMLITVIGAAWYSAIELSSKR